MQDLKWCLRKIFMHLTKYSLKTNLLPAVLCAFALVVACSCVALEIHPAWADVRKTDVVMGQSVDSRGLSVSQCPSIEAEYAYVCDDEGRVYFERNAQSETQIASITKVMCAIVALENATLDTSVTVSTKAAAIGESSANLQEGDVLTLDDALHALMVPSGNDAAQAIAECVGAKLTQGSESAYDAFVAAMNAKAAELGMANTVFENPHGLDFGTYAGNLHSSAEDVGKMCVYAMQNETFRSLVNQEEYTINVTRSGVSTPVVLESTDELLGVYEGACGIKTGVTQLAGPSFAGACERDGKTLYAVVINSTTEEQRFVDTTTLFDWVYEHTISYTLAHSSETCTMTLNGQTRKVPVIAVLAHSEWVDASINVTLADPDATINIFDLNGNISQDIELDTLNGDVNTGDKVGTITFKQRNNALISVDLIACEDQRAPNFFEGIGVWWDRLFRGFSGQSGSAETLTLNETPLVNDKTTSTTK